MEDLLLPIPINQNIIIIQIKRKLTSLIDPYFEKARSTSRREIPAAKSAT